jgi:tetratricopeptide (TPR) repeat protein
MTAGMAADQAGEYGRSQALYRKAVEISDSFEADDERRAYTWNALAKTQDVLGNYADAEVGYRRALRTAEQSRGKSSQVYTLVLANLATLYAETGQYRRGERIAREVLALVSGMNPPNELQLAMARSCLATIIDLAGKHDEAAGLTYLSLPVLERYPDAWTQTIGTLNTMGVALFAARQYAESERSFLRALTIAELHGGSEHPLLTRILSNLATIELRDGRREEAPEKLRRALGIAKTHLGVGHPMYGMLLAQYAGYLREAGEKSQAKALEAQSSQILKENGRRNGIGALIDVTALKK